MLQQKVYSSKKIAQFKDLNQTINSVEAGALLGGTNKYNSQETYTLTPLTEKAIILKKSNWGIFSQISSSSSCYLGRIVKNGLYGSRQPNKILTGLFLNDKTNSKLYFVGNTVLHGGTNIITKNIVPAFIEGKGFEGELPKRKKQLPPTSSYKPSEKYLDEIKERIKGTLFVNNDSLIDIKSSDYVFNSFTKKTAVITSESHINLFDKSLTGNIIIHSSKSIYVDSTSDLKNILLFAPTIYIGTGVNGSFQAFASDSLYVGDKVDLNYPSVLAVVNNNSSSLLFIDSNASISGEVYHFSKHDKSKTEVAENTTINGLIIDETSLSLKGVINGGVIANRFFYKTTSSTYNNHLIDCIIDDKQLSAKMGYGIKENTETVYPIISLN